MKPTFGLYDMAIANNANSSSNFWRCLYKHPIYAYKSNEARRFLGGGGEYFQLSEIEVYEKRIIDFVNRVLFFILKIEYFYK
jgi:hypothetical protein